MTVRYYIKCPSCGKITLVRVQMGYLDYHPIRYNCGTCKSTIHGDYKDGVVNFSNCEISQETNADFVIQTSGELLTHSLKKVDSFDDTIEPSPFINLSMIIHENSFEKFRKRFTFVLQFHSDYFPLVKSINEHYFNNNTDLLSQQIHKLLPVKQFPATNKLELLRAVHQANNIFFVQVMGEEFSLFTNSLFSFLDKLIENRQLFELANYFSASQLLPKWEKRAFQINNLMVENIHKFLPVIWFDLYTIDLGDEKNSERYSLTTTTFEEIESIYLKCYELLSDMLPLLVAYDNALVRDDFKTLKRHSMKSKASSIDEYIKISSKGIRIQYIDGTEPLEKILDNTFNKGIRNAIGHFSYEYELSNPFKQLYKFYDAKDSNKYISKNLLLLCLETWQMYLATFKLNEILYQTQKIILAIEGHKLDVTPNDMSNW